MSAEKVSEFIGRHGFGIFIAIVLLAEVLGFNPYSPLSALKAHTKRDEYRETLLLRICINTARDAAQANDCWASLFPEVIKR